MSVNFVFLVLSLLIDSKKWTSAQIMFDFEPNSISDTVKFKSEYDVIIIGAGTG